MTFAVFAVLVWLAWSAQVFAWPPGLARHLARLAPNFSLPSPAVGAAIGIAICVIWLTLAWRLPRAPFRAPANWALGMTMLWCLTIALLKPWFQHDRSYRPVAESLAIALSGERSGCVAELDLTASQLASFNYFAGVRPKPVRGNETPCSYLLVYADRSGNNELRPELPWQSIWEYRRGGGKQHETFRLYRRD